MPNPNCPSAPLPNTYTSPPMKLVRVVEVAPTRVPPSWSNSNNNSGIRQGLCYVEVWERGRSGGKVVMLD